MIVFQQLLVKLQAEVLHGLPPSADMPVFPAVADQVKQGHDLLIAVSVLPRAVFQPLDIPGFPGDPVALAEKCGVQEVRVQLCVQLFRQRFRVVGQKAALCLLRLNEIIVRSCHGRTSLSDYGNYTIFRFIKQGNLNDFACLLS